MKKRALSLVLTLCMLLGLLPTTALAAPATEEPTAEIAPAEIAEAAAQPLAAKAPAEIAEAAAQPLAAEAPAEIAEAAAQPLAAEDYAVMPLAAEGRAALPALKITLAGPSECRAYWGDNKSPFVPSQGQSCRGSYDGGTVEVINNGTSSTIHVKERGRFKNADYLYQPFDLEVQVPAYTTYTVDTDLSILMNRNSKGSTGNFVEWVRDVNYDHQFSTKDNLNVYGKNAGRTRSNYKTYNFNDSLSYSFYNSSSSTKSVTDREAMFVGCNSEGTIWSSYHHQMEASLTFKVTGYTATKHLTFDANGGSVSVSRKDFSGSSTTLPTPTRSGYTFLRWEDEDGNPWTGTYDADHGAKLTAQWKSATLYVGYRPNGGTVSGGTSNQTVGSKYTNLPTATREGYTFRGWYTSSSGGTKVDETTDVTRTGIQFLYAQWERTKYTLTFNGNGGTPSPSSKTVYHGDTLSSLPSATRTGYDLVGWFKTTTGGTQLTTSTVHTAGDTYYAHWTPKTMTVTLDGNGGTTTTPSISATYNSTYTNLNGKTATRANYNFLGWYTAASGGTQVADSTGKPTTAKVTKTADHILYAHWSRIQYKVTFAPNGGTPTTITPKTVYAGNNLGTLPTVTKTGHTFQGWYNDTTKVSSSTVPTGNAAYTAKWTAKTYTVTFNPNGGSTSTRSKGVTYNSTYGELPTPTRTGYNFAGWYTAADNTGSKVEATTKVAITGNQTLYAHWTAIGNIKVTFDGNGGTLTGDTYKNVTYGQPYGDLPVPTRTGYDFGGWFKARSGGTKVADNTGTATTAKVTNASAHKIYAHWKANTYTVTFTPGTGATVDSATKSVTYDRSYGELPTPTKTDYTFLGWFTEADGGAQVRAADVFKKTADQTLYAHWQPTNVKVTLDGNTDTIGGTASVNPESFTVPYGKPYGEGTYGANNESSLNGKLPKATLSGYIFTGWYTQPTGGTPVTATTVYQGKDTATTIFAHWQENHTHDVGGTVKGKTFNVLTLNTSTGNTLTGSAEGVNYYLTTDYTEAKGNVVTQTITISSGTVNLCLNGHTLTYNGSIQAFTVASGATLNICDCQGGGTISGTSRPAIGNDGTLHIYSGTISSKSNAIINAGSTGTVTVHGGTITSSNSSAIYNSSSTGTVTVEGGTISGTIGISNKSAGTSGNPGLTVSGGTITGNTGVGINNETSAATATVTGGTVTGKTHGIFSQGTLTVDGNAVVKGEGGSETSGIYVASGTAKISGSAQVEGYHGVYVKGGTLKVEGGTITGNGTHGIEVAAGAKLTMTDGTVNATEGNAYAVYLVNGAESNPDTTDTKSSITDGATLTGNYGVYVGEYRGLDMDGNAITTTFTAISTKAHSKVAATDCTVTNANSTYPTISNYGDLTLTGGSYTNSAGNCVVNSTTAKVTVDGATLISNSTDSNKAALNVSGGTATVQGNATLSGPTGAKVEAGAELNVKATTTGDTAGSPTITGTTGHGIQVAGADTTNNKPAGKLTMNGGTVKCPAIAGSGISVLYAVWLDNGTAEEIPTASSITNAILSGSHGVLVGGNRVLTAENTSVTTDSTGFFVYSELTATNCTVTSDGTAVTNSGKTTLTGGTYTTRDTATANTVSTSGSELTVNGATLIHESSTGDYAALNVGNHTATVKGNASLSGPIGASVGANGTLIVQNTGTDAEVKSPTITGTSYNGIYNQGKITISGGTITGMGTNYNGINNLGTTTVKGGTITAAGGAGIYNQGTLEVTNGSFSGVTGISLAQNKVMTLGGNPSITGTSRDIYFNPGALITVADGKTEGVPALDASAKFSVQASGDLTTGPVAITKPNASNEHDHFTSADYGVRSVKDATDPAKTVVQLYVPHSHPICGPTCTHDGAHEPVEFTELTAGGELAAGHYYLTGDMGSTDSPINLTIPADTTVDLCLNNFTLTGQISVRGTLNLCDCKTDGTVTPAVSSNSPVSITNGGTFNQYGGTVKAIYPVYVSAGSTWNFYGGKVTSISENSKPCIRPFGQINLLADMGNAYFSVQNSAKTPVHIGVKPKAAYDVSVDAGGVTFPVVVADGLPEGAELGQCLTAASSWLVLEKTDAGVILRTFNLDVKETTDGETKATLSADKQGKLTQAQLDAEPWEKTGYTWDGYYTDAAHTAANKVTVGTSFYGDRTIYPHWTECTHPGKDAQDAVWNTTTGATCHSEGEKTYTCDCGVTLSEAIPMTAHNVADVSWTVDAENGTHYKDCPNTGCDIRVDEAVHAWTAQARTDDHMTRHVTLYSCTCGQTKEEAVPTYTLTYVKGEHTTGEAANLTAVEEGDTITLPTLTRTGYTFQGWTEQAAAEAPEDTPATAAETGSGEGETPTETVLAGGAEYTMPAHDVTLCAQWQRIDNYQLQSGETMYLEDGTAITNDSNTTVTIQQPQNGSKTVITLPNGTAVTIDQDESGVEKVDVPAGSTVVTTTDGKEGPKVTIGAAGGSVGAAGGVEAGAGSKVEIPNKDGTTTTVTIGGGDGYITPDGGVTFPPADPENPGATQGTVTVDKGDGNGPKDVTVSGDSGGLDPSTGTVAESGPDDQVKLPDGTLVTVPDPNDPSKSGVVDGENGSTIVPAGSQVELGDGSTVTLDNTSGTVTATGDVTIPAGGTATVTDQNNHQTTVKVPAAGAGETGATGTVSNSGDITLPAGGSVSVEDGQGGHTEIKIPEDATQSGTITKNDDGTLTAPGGSTVTEHPATGEPGNPIEVPEGGQTVTPGTNVGITTELAPGESKSIPHVGTITNNNDGTATITDIHHNTTTVTIPGGGNITVDSSTGEIDLPGNSTVKTEPSGPVITVPEGATVAPGGTVTGESVKVGDTTVTVTDPNKPVTADPSGETTIPAGTTAEVTKGGVTTTVTVPTASDTPATVDPAGDVIVPAGGTVQTGTGPAITLPEGGSADESGNVTAPSVTVDGTTVTATDPAKPVTADPAGTTTIPAGTEATVTKGDVTTTVTVPAGEGENPATGAVKPDGSMDLPGGSQVTIPSGEGSTGNTTVTLPAAGGEVKPGADGGVTVPAGSTVQKPDGSSGGTVGEGGGTVAPGGDITDKPDTPIPGDTTTVKPGESVTKGDVTVTNKDDGTVTIADDTNTTTVTLPETGDVTVDNTTGGVTVPGGSEVKTGDGPVITLPETGDGGTVAPGGAVSGESVTVGDTTVTSTAPNKSVTADPSGDVTVPAGAEATVTDKDGKETTVTPGDKGNATVDPTTGAVELPAGGKVTIPGGEGEDDTVITAGTQGGTVTPKDDGTVDVPAGSTVQTGETGTPITMGDTTTGAVDPATGDVTVPAGGKVTIPDGKDGKTEITVPAGDTPGTVKPTTGGGVEAPGGSEVTNTDKDGNTTTNTVPEQGGTVAPGGDVTENDDPPTPPTPDTVTVTFNAMGGRPVPGAQRVTRGKAATEPTEPTRAGYTFLGWTTDKAGATAYDFASPVTGNITLYAQWKIITYTVTFDAQGGEPVPANQTVNAGKLVIKPDPSPSKESFTFGGWFAEAEHTTPWQFNTYTVSKDTTLYAQWTAKSAGTTVTPEAPVEIPGGGTVAKDPDTGDVTITKPGETGGVTVTPSDSGEGDVTVDTNTGDVTVPGGSTVTIPGAGEGGNTTVKLPDGGTVDADGNIHLNDGGDALTVPGAGGAETTITAPDGGGTLNTDPDSGTITVPGGSGVQTGNGPEITVPDGATVDPNTGAVTVPGGSTATIPDGNGSKTEVTVPGAADDTATLTPTPAGKVEIPADTVVKPGNGTELTVPGDSQIDAAGAVTVPGNSDVTIGDGSGNRTTVTVPGGSDNVVKPTQDGKVEVPADSTVKPGNGAELTVSGGSQVDAAGTVTVPTGGKVTIPDGSSGKTEISLPQGGSVDQDGAVTAEVSSVLVVENAPDVAVNGLDDEALAVKAEETAADSVTVTMTVTGKTESTADHASDIKDTAQGRDLEYMEIKVEKTVGTGTRPIPIPTTSELMTVIIPFESAGKHNVVVYRYHGDKVDTITEEKNGDREYMELGADAITLHVKNFSTYAVGYTETAEPPEPPAPSYTGGSSSPSIYPPKLQQSEHGTITVSPARPEKGDEVTITVKAEEGYEVDTVTVTDRSGKPVEVTKNADGTFTFTQPGRTVTVSATLKESDSAASAACPKDATCPAAPFTDLDLNAWYHDGVHFCVEKGLMSGYGNGSFGPSDTLSRAMLAQILYNQAGKPAVSGAVSFPDLVPGKWYLDAVSWAAEKGIVTGYGDGSFGPDDPITREQLAVMLWRYAKATGRDVSVGEDTNILSYTDFDQISEWAIPALQWAAGAGVMTGKDGGRLDPTGQATRAEAAAMLQRYIQLDK